MDYAIQLLTIIGLFLAAGLWLRDHFGWPSLVVVVMMVLGVVCGLIVLYQRSTREAATSGSSLPSNSESGVSENTLACRRVIETLPSAPPPDVLADLRSELNNASPMTLGDDVDQDALDEQEDGFLGDLGLK